LVDILLPSAVKNGQASRKALFCYSNPGIMSENPKNHAAETVELELGTYELLRSRLQNQYNQLSKQLNTLDQARQEVFGSVKKEIVGTNRIHTKNYCIARDLTSLGTNCLLGYNVHVGLRSAIQLEDVFSAYTFDGELFHESSLELLQDDKFLKDFNNLYRYYKEAQFTHFVHQEAYLFMVFQVSEKIGDIKAFKWLVTDEKLHYIDARSEKEIQLPKQFDFTWTEAGRDAQRNGKHPHISIEDRVFVEAVGGDITIKVEDNTDDGLGIYREEVEYKDQTLDDGIYRYALLDHLIVISIQPYQEHARYFIFNEKTQQVEKFDALARNGILLPDGHGVIFPNGYCLKTGVVKKFEEEDTSGMHFIRSITAPNGEDYLYIYYDVKQGIYKLLHYNIINQQVDTPVKCNGYARFPDGVIAYFKAESEAARHHLIQVWRTPFSNTYISPVEDKDNPLYKLGNREIVRALADGREIQVLLSKDDSYNGLYEDIEKACINMMDQYHWLDAQSGQGIYGSLKEIRDTALTAIEALDKKREAQKYAREAYLEVEQRIKKAAKTIELDYGEGLDALVEQLSSLRYMRGEVIGLRERRYVDIEATELLEEQVVRQMGKVGERCIKYLMDEKALQAYYQQLEKIEKASQDIEGSADVRDLMGQLNQVGEALQTLLETIGYLKIEDGKAATEITERLSILFGRLNQQKAQVQQQAKATLSQEAKGRFHAELLLLEQSAANFLASADHPQKCDELLNKVMVQVEELEARFSDYEGFVEQLVEKREDLYKAFDTQKRQLQDQRNARGDALKRSGDRLLKSIVGRSGKLEDDAEIHAFYSSDLMVDKVRNIVQELRDLDETGRANALNTALIAARDETLRQIKDKKELYLDGQNVIRLGDHAFEVNVQPLSLAIVERDGQLFYHLTGTDFYEAIEDEVVNKYQAFWGQPLLSESKKIYRAEFLAYDLWKQGLGRSWVEEIKALEAEELHPELLKEVGSAAVSRLEEGYMRGIHDEDACRILQALLVMEEELGTLHFPPGLRAEANLIWHKLLDPETKAELALQLQSVAYLLEVFPEGEDFEQVYAAIEEAIEGRVSGH
jgi:hypothetical protein